MAKRRQEVGAGKVLPCVCDPARRLARVPLKKLMGFQGNLKKLPPDQYAKLKASLEQKGFFSPVFIWSGHDLILDGHQRVAVLLQEGWDVDGGVPVVEIEASDEKDAAEKLLLISSAYGKVDHQGLHDFTLAHGISLPEFPLIDLPDFDFAAFEEQFNPAPPPTGAVPPAQSLAERFGVPPFSVLDARQGYWQVRKRAWLSIGIRSELGRGDDGGGAAPGGSPLDAATLGEDGKTVRGDGTGNRLTWVRGSRQDGELDDTSRKILAAGKKKKTLGAIPDNQGKLLSPGYRDQQSNKKGLLGFSEQALTKYKGKAAAVPSGSRFPANHLGPDGKFGREDLHMNPLGAKDFGTEGNISEMSGTSIFDPVLCELAYRWFCPIGGTVFDPFAGGSVRGIVASRLGRNYVGIDLSGRQIEANREQGEILSGAGTLSWIEGDSRYQGDLLPAKFEADLVFTCPPYGSLEVYSDNPADISAMDHDAFLIAYREIIKGSCDRLRRDRFAAIVVGDFRDGKGFYRNFISDTIFAFQDAGLMLYNEAILITAIGSLSIRAGRPFVATRKLGKTHQNVLVFCKGDPVRATKACGEVECGEVPEMEGGGIDLSISFPDPVVVEESGITADFPCGPSAQL